MVFTIYISNLLGENELDNLETKLSKTNIVIKSRFRLDEFCLDYLEIISTENILIIINPNGNKIKALEICKRLNNAKTKVQVIVLLENLDLEAANTFGFHKTFITNPENIHTIIPRLNYYENETKKKKLIIFASLTESEKDSLKNLLSFAKYLSLKEKKILILEYSNSQLLNNSLRDETNEDKANCYEKKSLFKIKSCDYLKRNLSVKEKLKISNKNTSMAIEFLNRQLNNNNNQDFNEKEKLISSLKSENLFQESNIINQNINSYDYILVDIGTDFISDTSKYFFNSSNEIFISTRNKKHDLNSFYEIKNYLNKHYQINSQSLITDKETFFDSEQVDLYKFLNSQIFLKANKNRSQELARLVFQTVNKGDDLCLLH